MPITIRPTSTVILDPQGQPRVFFHGASQKRESFKVTTSLRHTLGHAYEVQTPAFFFTPDLSFAQTFGAQVTAVHVHARKVLDLREGAWGQNDLAAFKILENHFGEAVGLYPVNELWSILDDAPSAQAIGKLGYEAVLFCESDRHGNSHETLAVFNASSLEIISSNELFKGIEARAMVQKARLLSTRIAP